MKIWLCFKIDGQASDEWPDALDHLAIGLVDNKYTKLGKIGAKSVTYFGVGPYKSPTVLTVQ